MPEGNLDFVITGDFRYPGGTSAAIAEEIKILKNSTLSWKLDQFDSKVFRDREINEKVSMLVSPSDFLGAERTECDTWFVHNPHCLRWGIPERRIDAKKIVIVAHQAPLSFVGKFYYNPWKIDAWFRKAHPESEVIWAPISPLCRRMFEVSGFDGSLLNFDWYNVFSGPFDDPEGIEDRRLARVGCHGRPQAEKWPATRAEALAVYPDDDGFQVTLLGPDRKLSGPIFPYPARWTVYEFNEIAVEEYLRMIDFFVYWPSPDLVEAFGRTIAEAILNGKLAVLPRSLEPTFGDLAVYADPWTVRSVVESFQADPGRYFRTVTYAAMKARNLYGPSGLESRFDKVRTMPPDSLSVRPAPNPSIRRKARAQLLIRSFLNEAQPLVNRFFPSFLSSRLRRLVRWV